MQGIFSLKVVNEFIYIAEESRSIFPLAFSYSYIARDDTMKEIFA